MRCIAVTGRRYSAVTKGCNTQVNEFRISMDGKSVCRAQGQDEFYFALPYQDMDVAIFCYNNGATTEEMANELSISEEQAGNVYLHIENKRKMSQKN